MYLHSILLSGFKTFPVRTQIKFHPGITSIVGPNGSGKSNIVDAILWAMGEGRSSLLRASRMEDVIFKGSSSRSALSRAEVLLNFVQGEESLTIGRRIYREGDSEFLINGSSARLRDVQDKLREIGIESREYVVVEQGQVETFLNMSPQERLVFLEALAGVTMFRERKKEALRNLIRIEDKLSLVKIREEEIKQAYERIKGELEVLKSYRALTLELEKLFSTLLLKRREKIISSLSDLSRQEEKIQAKLVNLSSQKEALLGKARKLSEARAGLLEKINLMERERGEVKQERAELSPEIISLTGRLSSLEEKLEGARRKKQELSSRKAFLEKRMEKLRNLLEDEREKYLQLHERFQEVKEKLRQTEAMVEAIRKDYLEKSGLYKQRIALQEERERERNRREKRLKEALREREKVKKKIEALEKRVVKFPSGLSKIMEEISRQREKLSEISRRKSVAEEKLKQVRRTLDFLQKAVQGKRLKKIRIKEEFSDLAEILWERELSAEILQDGELSPGLYLIEKNWENEDFKELSGAEVPFRDALWRQSFREAIEAWEKTGKPVVFPEGVIFPEGVLRIKGQTPGTLSLLIQMEELEREAKGLEEEIEKLKDEERELKKTVEELVHRAKALERQKLKAEQEQKRIEKEIHRLREKLSALDAEIERLSTYEEEPEEDLSSLASEIETLEERLHSLEKKLSKERGNYSEVSTELKVSNREIVRLEEELENAEKNLKRTLREIEGLEGKAFHFEEEISRLRKNLQELRARDRKLGEKEEKLGKEISTLLGENGEIENKLKGVDRKIERIRAEEERLNVELGEVKVKMSELRERLEALKREAMDRVGKPLLSLQVHYELSEEELKERIAEVEEKREALGEINFKAEREESEIREQLEEIQIQRRDLEESVKKAKEALLSMETSYREKIERAFLDLKDEYSRLFSAVAEGEALMEFREGLHVSVRFKGKNFQPLSMLSGGERALASLLFYIALFRIKPAPFLVLDEVDAPLDLPNVQKLINLIKELRKDTQVIIITHNPATARHADFIYGISMPEDGTSRVYSMRAEELFNSTG